MFWDVDCTIQQNDATEGKNMQISAKIYQNYAKLGKNKPFFAYKTLVLLKKRSKSTFQPMKMCSKWVHLEMSWVDFECFYAIWWRSRWFLNRLLATYDLFWPFLSQFWPCSQLYRAILDQNGTKIGPFWGNFGPFLGRPGVILGSLRDHWHRFGIILGLQQFFGCLHLGAKAGSGSFHASTLDLGPLVT